MINDSDKPLMSDALLQKTESIYSTTPTKSEEIASQKQLEKYAVQPDSRGAFKKAVEQNKQEEKLFENIIDNLGKPKAKTPLKDDTRDFKDKRGERFINKTLKPVEKDTDPRGVAFNPTTQLFTNKDRTIAFKTYDEADTWNKTINVKTKYYQDEATPEQVGALAERMERSRQMNGADGRYDKAIIKKRKPILNKKPYKIEPFKVDLSNIYVRDPVPVAPRDNRPIKQIIDEHANKRLREQQDFYDQRYGKGGIAGLRRPD